MGRIRLKSQLYKSAKILAHRAEDPAVLLHSPCMAKTIWWSRRSGTALNHGHFVPGQGHLSLSQAHCTVTHRKIPAPLPHIAGTEGKISPPLH